MANRKLTTDDIKKMLLIIAGSVTLILGLVGVFIPVLPTTPFLLLTAFCYARSSKRLYDWLMNHKVLGPYIYNYVKHHAIHRRTKISALFFLWLSLTLSIILVDHLHVRILLLVVGLAVSLHLISLRTIKEKKPPVIKKPESDERVADDADSSQGRKKDEYN